MAKNFFKRYIWLVDLLSRRNYISLQEISDEWRKSPLNDTHAPLSERTFFNHRDAIFDIFGIEIKNDRSLGFYIASSEMDGDSTGEWMLHTLCLNNVLQELLFHGAFVEVLSPESLRKEIKDTAAAMTKIYEKK